MGKNFRETLNQQLNDPPFRAEWDTMEPERQIMRAMLDGREAKAMTQKDLAAEVEAMKNDPHKKAYSSFAEIMAEANEEMGE